MRLVRIGPAGAESWAILTAWQVGNDPSKNTTDVQALKVKVRAAGLSFWSLKLAGDLASPAIIMQSYVPMAVLFAWLIRGERFAWRSGLAILVSFAGILVLGFDPIVLDNPQSMVLMLVSALFLAIGTVLMRGLSGIDAFSMQAWSAWIGLGPLLGWSALVEPGAWHAVQDASWYQGPMKDVVRLR